MEKNLSLCCGELGYFRSWHKAIWKSFLCVMDKLAFVCGPHLFVSEEICAWRQNQQHGMQQSLEKRYYG